MKKLHIPATVLAASLLVFGCSNNQGPVESTSAGSPDPAVYGSNSTNTLTMETVTLLTLPPALSKTNPPTFSKTITPQSGATFYGSYTYKRKNGGDSCKVDACLMIPPGAVLSPVTITMTFEKDFIGVNFGPSPFTFQKQIVFSMTAKGIDAPPANSALGMYYVDPAGNKTVIASGLVFDYNGNRIAAQVGLTNHFSRYIFGRVAAQ